MIGLLALGLVLPTASAPLFPIDYEPMHVYLYICTSSCAQPCILLAAYRLPCIGY